MAEEKATAEGEAEDETTQAEKKQQGEKKGVHGNAIRKTACGKLHAEMDKHIDNRHSRFLHAELTKDTTTQWDLIAAAVEEANVRYHGLVGKESSKMRGRSKTSSKKQSGNVLEGIEYAEDTAEQVKRTNWLRKAAGDHTVMGKSMQVTTVSAKGSRGVTNSMAVPWKQIASLPKR